jgi:hypothetical protein
MEGVVEQQDVGVGVGLRRRGWERSRARSFGQIQRFP